MLILRGLFGVTVLVLFTIYILISGDSISPTAYAFATLHKLFLWYIFCASMQFALLMFRFWMFFMRATSRSLRERRIFRRIAIVLDHVIFGERFTWWNLGRLLVLNAFLLLGTGLFLLSGEKHHSWFDLNEYLIVGAAVSFFLAYYAQFARPNSQPATS